MTERFDATRACPPVYLYRGRPQRTQPRRLATGPAKQFGVGPRTFKVSGGTDCRPVGCHGNPQVDLPS